MPPDFIKRLPIRLTYDNNYFNAKYQGVADYNEIVKKQTEKCDIVLGVSGFTQYTSKNIIYTGALDELFDYCYGELEWRSLDFETWAENTENYQGCAVMNFNGDEPFTRITEHKHFLSEKSDVTILTKEYPCEWKAGKERYYPIKSDRNIQLYEKYRQKAEKYGIFALGRLGEYKYINMDEAVENAINLYYRLEGV